MNTNRKPSRSALAWLFMTLFAASPAIQPSGLSGLALAADTPPAVAQPDGAANNDMKGADNAEMDSSAGAPDDDLMYRRTTYVYASSRLRDPFGSLVTGKFKSDGETQLPDIGAIDLLGVIWGEVDKFAMVEDKEGNGYILRVGDPVVNGEVAGITRSTVTFRQYFFGTSTTITLKLKPREVKANAR